MKLYNNRIDQSIKIFCRLLLFIGIPFFAKDRKGKKIIQKPYCLEIYYGACMGISMVITSPLFSPSSSLLSYIVFWWLFSVAFIIPLGSILIAIVRFILG